MTFIEIIDLFTLYGVDVVVLGIVTSALTQILKTTIFKNAPNKLYAFLPVIIGTMLYVVYSMLTHMSFEYALENLAYLLDKGFSVGAAATVIYVICEQFMKGTSSHNLTDISVVAAMIGELVDSEKLNTVAQMIVNGLDLTDLHKAACSIETVLRENAQGDAEAEGFAAVSVVIAKTLAKIKTTAP